MLLLLIVIHNTPLISSWVHLSSLTRETMSAAGSLLSFSLIAVVCAYGKC